ncbi:MAG: cysteine desulfurase family protein [Oscillospiraceae bacterium]
MIYLDNAATTKVCPEAAEAALRMMTGDFGNPSSLHGLGRTARAALKSARETVAASIGAKPEEIFFTAGGTEGDNWALRSGAQLMRHKGRHIISSTTEHDAVLKSLDRLEADGFEVTRLTPGPDGAISADAVAEALREDTILVSLMLVNNETGAITDIPAVSNALKAAKSNALLHTDAVQGFLKVPFTVKSLGADMITLSGHKIHAPKGVGALYVRAGLRLPALLLGGGQEDGKRSGTENLPGICAFAAAIAAAQNDADSLPRMAALRQRVLDTFAASGVAYAENSGGAPHILNLSLPGYRAETILNTLDRDGICISTGSACKRGKRSHVLTAMGLPPRVIDGAIRVSLCRFTTEADIDGFCDALIRASQTLIKTS